VSREFIIFIIIRLLRAWPPTPPTMRAALEPSRLALCSVLFISSTAWSQDSLGSDSFLPNSLSPTCWLNTAQDVPSHVSIHDQHFLPSELLLAMRASVCHERCEKLHDVENHNTFSNVQHPGDCLSIIHLPNSTEAYLYRLGTTHGEAFYQCQDTIADIVSGCVRNGPHRGSLLGDHDKQQYEVGFRPMETHEDAEPLFEDEDDANRLTASEFVDIHPGPRPPQHPPQHPGEQPGGKRSIITDY